MAVRPPGSQTPQSERARRLAAALRANLQRRKAKRRGNSGQECAPDAGAELSRTDQPPRERPD